MKYVLILISILWIGNFKASAQHRKKGKYHYSQKFATEQEIQKEPLKIKRALMAIAGHYDNETQAKLLNNPLYSEQEFLILPIFEQKRQGEYWFYIAWFSKGQYSKALGDGICKLEKYKRDTFLVKAYPTPELEAFEWQKEKAFENLDLKALMAHGHCTSYLVEKEPGIVELFTEDLCPHRLSDQIHYHKIQIDFLKDGLLGYSSYYDEKGNLLFTYPKELPTNFVRIKFLNKK